MNSLSSYDRYRVSIVYMATIACLAFISIPLVALFGVDSGYVAIPIILLSYLGYLLILTPVIFVRTISAIDHVYNHYRLIRWLTIPLWRPVISAVLLTRSLVRANK